MPSNPPAEGPLGRLTERESEILRKAGERVFALSKQLAHKEKESDQLRSETSNLRELLAESREVRKVLTDQISSLQRELDREYDERSELRRLLASLHMQMQELLPVVTRLSQAQLTAPAASKQIRPSLPPGEERNPRASLAQRLFAASGIVSSSSGKRRRR